MTKKQKTKPFFSICIPVYKGSKVLPFALRSIFNQNFQDFEIIIGDDNPQELKEEIKKTKEILHPFSTVIKYIKHKKNIGCQRNVEYVTKLARGEVLFFLAQDDVLGQGALQKTYAAFQLDKDIGAVTRPYYWFEKDIRTPVRDAPPFDKKRNRILSLQGTKEEIVALFQNVGQISGLAYRRKWIDVPFHDDVFPGHIYPYAGIVKKHKCVFLKDYTVAVRIETSQSRHISSLYDASPLESWVTMFERVYPEKEYQLIRKHLINELVAKNYLGLVQIRNFAKYRYVLREIGMLIKYRPLNMIEPLFWFFSLGVLVIPRKVLLWLVDNYKRQVESKRIQKISFTTAL